MYEIESLNISNKCVKELQSTQGFIMKQVCDLSKRSHHSGLLQAVNIESANVYINNANKTLFGDYVPLILLLVIYVYTF